jgi:hypothetical protein
MSISTTTSTTTVAPCFSPIEYLLKEAQRLSESSNNTISLYDAFVSLSSKGLVLDNCNSCFCGCNYFLGSVDLYNYYYNDNDYVGVPSCCVNVFGSVETYIKYLEEQPVPPTPPNPVTVYRRCCNGFNDCFDEFYKRLLKDGCDLNKFPILDNLLDLGLVEQMPPGYDSQICLLIDTLDEITNCGCYSDILLYIIANGLHIVCDETTGTVSIYTTSEL